MRAYGSRFGFGVLLGVLVVGVGCEVNNFYGCEAVDDGGCEMRGGPASDHWGDDELSEDAGPGQNTSSVFTQDSMLQGSDTLTLTRGPVPAGGGGAGVLTTFPDVDLSQGGKGLINVATRGSVPQVVTVSMARLGGIPPMILGNPLAEVVAVLEIGIGGLLFTAEIDFVDGVQFSLAVSSLRISGIYRTLPGDATAFLVGPLPEVRVGASVALGAIAHGRAPQRTLTSVTGLAVNIGGTGEIWTVPRFAKAFRVTARPAASSISTLFLGTTGGGGPTATTTIAFPSAEMPVPSDAYSIFVQNTGLAALSPGYSLIFDLAL
jgi:hypothetical protein